MKALEMLKDSVSVSKRADKFVVSIKRNIQKDVIDALTTKKEKIEDDLFELGTFQLETDANKGLRALTKEECEVRFKRIIDLEYQLRLTDLELKFKQESFDKYFKD